MISVLKIQQDIERIERLMRLVTNESVRLLLATLLEEEKVKLRLKREYCDETVVVQPDEAIVPQVQRSAGI